MKYYPAECRRGDVIRVRVRSLYHYGIFISDDEVIQFGPRPDMHPESAAKITVISTGIDEFSRGDIVEVRVLDRSEKKKCRRTEEVIACARARLGEGGYDILKNNCEHFVNECTFGERKSFDVESVRSGWEKRPLFKIYLKEILPVGEAALYPPERQAEIDGCSSQKVKDEKYAVWQLLEFALSHAFAVDIKELKFTKSKSGKWACGDKYLFSLSHSGGVACVAVSNADVGVDIEEEQGFVKKFEDKLNGLLVKILTPTEKKNGQITSVYDAVKVWSAKESLYKLSGRGAFRPESKDASCADVRMIEAFGKRLCLACCGKHSSRAEIYLIDKGQTIHRL